MCWAAIRMHAQISNDLCKSETLIEFVEIMIVPA